VITFKKRWSPRGILRRAALSGPVAPHVSRLRRAARAGAHRPARRSRADELQRLRRQKPGAVQPLLVPHVVRLPAAAASRVSEAADLLASAGIQLEPFGDDSIAIKALPPAARETARKRARTLLTDLADELEAHGRGDSLDRLRDQLSPARPATQRPGATISWPPARQALLDALDETDYGARCAHGRRWWPSGARPRSRSASAATTNRTLTPRRRRRYSPHRRPECTSRSTELSRHCAGFARRLRSGRESAAACAACCSTPARSLHFCTLPTGATRET